MPYNRVVRAPIAAAVLAVLVTFSPAAGDVYRWVDERGTVHLDDDLARVPEPYREAARVFRSKPASVGTTAVDPTAPTQASFADAIARDLGLRSSESQDSVSVLQITGIYPARGWDPTAALSPIVVTDVVSATIAAAQARRLSQSPAAAEMTIIRAAQQLGVAAPPPTVAAPTAPPPEPATIVVAPNIVVEAPPQPQVIIHEIERVQEPVLASRVYDPAWAYGVPFASTVPHPAPIGPIPPRIVPLQNPAGHLHGPLVPPLRMGPLTRPHQF